MRLHQLTPNKPKVARKRRGQGRGTGNGTFGGRGLNGQNARSGGGVRKGFEGGQSSLIQRMPKMKGFKSPNKVISQVVDVATLDGLFKDGDKVNTEILVEMGVIHANKGPAKVLASGEITKKLTIEGLAISAGAKAAIEKVGGSVA